MTSKHFDPDLKINMSLEQIIQLTKSDLLPQLRGRYFNGFKRKNRNKKQKNIPTCKHSVPLMSSLGGGYVYVTKKSPLLSAENVRRITTAAANRFINSDLIEKSKEIIPASYKLVKTNSGVERILVPVEQNVIDALRRKEMMTDFLLCRPFNKKDSSVQPPVWTEILNCNRWGNSRTNNQFAKMEVDESDDEVVILDQTNGKQNKAEPVVINVEPYSQANSLDLKMTSIIPQKQVTTTLNDRFTLLSCGTDLS